MPELNPIDELAAPTSAAANPPILEYDDPNLPPEAVSDIDIINRSDDEIELDSGVVLPGATGTATAEEVDAYFDALEIVP